jgi:ATP-binding cassette, subfamily C (CFTR/MRP), member 1
MLTAWINYRLEIITSFLVGGTAFLVVATKQIPEINSQISVVVFALVLSWIFALGSILSFTIFTLSEVIKGMSSVERVFEYIRYKEHEQPWETPRAAANWPSKGEIEFKNVSVRYREGLPLVLNNVSTKIQSNTKCGIVGRTGSGKSTVILTIMRILELEGFEPV